MPALRGTESPGHTPTTVAVPTMLATRGRPARVARLCAELPELAPATVRAAIAVVRCGADADELVRLLRLTAAQALRISTALSGTDRSA